MEIKEIKDKKMQLEIDIYRLIEEFEGETFTTVEDVQLVTSQRMDGGSQLITVKTTVKL